MVCSRVIFECINGWCSSRSFAFDNERAIRAFACILWMDGRRSSSQIYIIIKSNRKWGHNYLRINPLICKPRSKAHLYQLFNIFVFKLFDVNIRYREFIVCWKVYLGSMLRNLRIRFSGLFKRNYSNDVLWRCNGCH